jgi:hypothetical protein
MAAEDGSYRDFIYLDIDRVQSILAQLEEGLLTDIIAGKEREVAGKGGAAAGILSQLLPIGISIQGRLATDIRQSKVLHDHAYTVALDSLQKRRLILDATEFDREQFPVPDSAFVMVTGSTEIVDFRSISKLAENESTLTRLFSSATDETVRDVPQNLNRQQRRAAARQGMNPQPQSNAPFSQMKDFIDVFYGDMIQAIMETERGVRFVGILNRAHLREAIQDIIFKYGSRPQGDWTLLAQVTRIPTPEDDLNSMEARTALINQNSLEEATNPGEMMKQALSMLNIFQEFMGSPTYPNIAMSPIALYREVMPVD